MTRMLGVIITLFMILTTPLYAGDDHANGHGDHDHGVHESDKEHSHEPASREGASPEAFGQEGHAHGGDGSSVAVTRWTEEVELFMEYPVLAAGEPGRFIIHLTVLQGFQPVRAGTVALTFREADGTAHQVVAEELLREGIFSPTVRLPRAGAYSFDLSYRGPEVSSSFRIDGFRVFPGPESIPAEAEDKASGEITFLKEQQWKIPFATSEAVTREVKRAVWAIAEVMPAPAAYVEIVAPVDGVLQVDGSRDLAVPGSRVRRGDVLAAIVPPLKGDSWVASRLAFSQAERNLDRATRLRKIDAISEREYEEASNEYLSRKAGHERLAGVEDGSLLKLTAPIDGKVVDWQVRPGQHLSAGDRLMAVADPSLVWLKVNVYEQDFRELGIPVGVFVNAGGVEGGWMIPESDMRVLTIGGALDPVTRTIPVLLEVANTEERLRINESSPVELYASDSVSSTAVPRTAVYDDDGMDVVFVQIGGESFEKRIVSLGPRYAEWVSILEGIDPGERVVARGGYHVKLASTSVEIGHGHAH